LDVDFLDAAFLVLPRFAADFLVVAAMWNSPDLEWCAPVTPPVEQRGVGPTPDRETATSRACPSGRTAAKAAAPARPAGRDGPSRRRRRRSGPVGARLR
jgi:hypothetical protein